MSNRTPTRSRLSLLIAAAIFGASGAAAAQSADPAEIPVDDISVQADLDEDAVVAADEEDEEDESALAASMDQDKDDLDVDGDFDPEVDPETEAHAGGSVQEQGDMAAVPTKDATLAGSADQDGDNVDVDGDFDAEVDPDVEAHAGASVQDDDASMAGMGFESDSDMAVSGDTSASSGMDAAVASEGTSIETTDAAGDPAQVEAGPPADAFAATAGSEGFSEGATAQNAAQRFGELDGDSSGSLSEEEVASVQPLQDSFAEYDLNDDGSLAENEFQSFFAATADVDSDVQTAQVGDGTMDASDRAMEQDVAAASTEPATDTAIASESTGDLEVDSDAADMTASTGTDATSEAAAESGTGDVSTSAESTAATEAGSTTDYDSYSSGTIAEGEEMEAEEDPTADEE